MEKIPATTRDGLLQLAHADSEREICGFIMRDFSIVQSPNMAHHSKTRFEIDPAVQLELANRERANMLGIYHSHPSGDLHPSHRDIEGWPAWDARYWIVANGRVVEWKKHDDGSIERIDVSPAIRSRKIELAGSVYQTSAQVR